MGRRIHLQFPTLQNGIEPESVLEHSQKRRTQRSPTAFRYRELSSSRPELQAMLTTPNGLHAVTHAVFRGGRRQHVDSIAFTIPQSIRPDGTGAKRLSGDLIVLNNPQPLFPCDEVRSIFRSP
jgi:hypothetical protein